MKLKNLVVLTLLLTQTAPVWAMISNEDIERESTNYRPAISSISTDGDLIVQAPTIQSTGSLIVQEGEFIIGVLDDENSMRITGSSITSAGDLTLNASDIYLDNSTIKSTGRLVLTASGSIEIRGNTSLKSNQYASINYNK